MSSCNGERNTNGEGVPSAANNLEMPLQAPSVESNEVVQVEGSSDGECNRLQCRAMQVHYTTLKRKIMNTNSLIGIRNEKNKEIERLKRELAETKARKEGEIKTLGDQLHQTLEQLEPYKQRVKEAEGLCERRAQEVKASERQVEQLLQAKKCLEDKCNDLEERLNEAKKASKTQKRAKVSPEASARDENQQKKIIKLQEKYKTIKQELAQQKKENTQLTKKVEKLTEELKKQKEKAAAAKTHGGGGRGRGGRRGRLQEDGMSDRAEWRKRKSQDPLFGSGSLFEEVAKQPGKAVVSPESLDSGEEDGHGLGRAAGVDKADLMQRHFSVEVQEFLGFCSSFSVLSPALSPAPPSPRHQGETTDGYHGDSDCSFGSISSSNDSADENEDDSMSVLAAAMESELLESPTKSSPVKSSPVKVSPVKGPSQKKTATSSPKKSPRRVRKREAARSLVQEEDDNHTGAAMKKVVSAPAQDARSAETEPEKSGSAEEMEHSQKDASTAVKTNEEEAPEQLSESDDSDDGKSGDNNSDDDKSNNGDDPDQGKADDSELEMEGLFEGEGSPMLDTVVYSPLSPSPAPEATAEETTEETLRETTEEVLGQESASVGDSPVELTDIPPQVCHPQAMDAASAGDAHGSNQTAQSQHPQPGFSRSDAWDGHTAERSHADVSSKAEEHGRNMESGSQQEVSEKRADNTLVKKSESTGTLVELQSDAAEVKVMVSTADSGEDRVVDESPSSPLPHAQIEAGLSPRRRRNSAFSIVCSPRRSAADTEENFKYLSEDHLIMPSPGKPKQASSLGDHAFGQRERVSLFRQEETEEEAEKSEDKNQGENACILPMITENAEIPADGSHEENVKVEPMITDDADRLVDKNEEEKPSAESMISEDAERVGGNLREKASVEPMVTEDTLPSVDTEQQAAEDIKTCTGESREDDVLDTDESGARAAAIKSRESPAAFLPAGTAESSRVDKGRTCLPDLVEPGSSDKDAHRVDCVPSSSGEAAVDVHLAIGDHEEDLPVDSVDSSSEVRVEKAEQDLTSRRSGSTSVLDTIETGNVTASADRKSLGRGNKPPFSDEKSDLQAAGESTSEEQSDGSLRDNSETVSVAATADSDSPRDEDDKESCDISPSEEVTTKTGTDRKTEVEMRSQELSSNSQHNLCTQGDVGAITSANTQDGFSPLSSSTERPSGVQPCTIVTTTPYPAASITSVNSQEDPSPSEAKEISSNAGSSVQNRSPVLAQSSPRGAIDNTQEGPEWGICRQGSLPFTVSFLEEPTSDAAKTVMSPLSASACDRSPSWNLRSHVRLASQVSQSSVGPQSESGCEQRESTGTVGASPTQQTSLPAGSSSDDRQKVAEPATEMPSAQRLKSVRTELQASGGEGMVKEDAVPKIFGGASSSTNEGASHPFLPVSAAREVKSAEQIPSSTAVTRAVHPSHPFPPPSFPLPPPLFPRAASSSSSGLAQKAASALTMNEIFKVVVSTAVHQPMSEFVLDVGTSKQSPSSPFSSPESPYDSSEERKLMIDEDAKEDLTVTIEPADIKAPAILETSSDAVAVSLAVAIADDSGREEQALTTEQASEVQAVVELSSDTVAESSVALAVAVESGGACDEELEDGELEESDLGERDIPLDQEDTSRQSLSPAPSYSSMLAFMIIGPPLSPLAPSPFPRSPSPSPPASPSPSPLLPPHPVSQRWQWLLMWLQLQRNLKVSEQWCCEMTCVSDAPKSAVVTRKRKLAEPEKWALEATSFSASLASGPTSPKEQHLQDSQAQHGAARKLASGPSSPKQQHLQESQAEPAAAPNPQARRQPRLAPQVRAARAAAMINAAVKKAKAPQPASQPLSAGAMLQLRERMAMRQASGAPRGGPTPGASIQATASTSTAGQVLKPAAVLPSASASSQTNRTAQRGQKKASNSTASQNKVSQAEVAVSKNPPSDSVSSDKNFAADGPVTRRRGRPPKRGINVTAGSQGQAALSSKRGSQTYDDLAIFQVPSSPVARQRNSSASSSGAETPMSPPSSPVTRSRRASANYGAAQPAQSPSSPSTRPCRDSSLSPVTRSQRRLSHSNDPGETTAVEKGSPVEGGVSAGPLKDGSSSPVTRSQLRRLSHSGEPGETTAVEKGTPMEGVASACPIRDGSSSPITRSQRRRRLSYSSKPGETTAVEKGIPMEGVESAHSLGDVSSSPVTHSQRRLSFSSEPGETAAVEKGIPMEGILEDTVLSHVPMTRQRWHSSSTASGDSLSVSASPRKLESQPQTMVSEMVSAVGVGRKQLQRTSTQTEQASNAMTHSGGGEVKMKTATASTSSVKLPEASALPGPSTVQVPGMPQASLSAQGHSHTGGVPDQVSDMGTAPNPPKQRATKAGAAWTALAASWGTGSSTAGKPRPNAPMPAVSAARAGTERMPATRSGQLQGRKRTHLLSMDDLPSAHPVPAKKTRNTKPPSGSAAVQAQGLQPSVPASNTLTECVGAALRNCVQGHHDNADKQLSKLITPSNLDIVWPALCLHASQILQGSTGSLLQFTMESCMHADTLADKTFLTTVEIKLVNVLTGLIRKFPTLSWHEVRKAVWQLHFSKATISAVGRAALCRFFVHVCRLQGDVHGARMLLYYTFMGKFTRNPQVVLACLSAWPACFKQVPHQPELLWTVMEFILHKHWVPHDGNFAKISQCLATLSDWHAPFAEDAPSLMKIVMQKLQERAGTEEEASLIHGVELLCLYQDKQFIQREIGQRCIQSLCDKWRSQRMPDTKHFSAVLKLFCRLYHFGDRPLKKHPLKTYIRSQLLVALQVASENQAFQRQLFDALLELACYGTTLLVDLRNWLGGKEGPLWQDAMSKLVATERSPRKPPKPFSQRDELPPLPPLPPTPKAH